MNYLILFLLLTFSLFAGEKVTLSPLEPFESERDPELEVQFREHLIKELLLQDYEVVLLEGSGLSDLPKSKELQAKLHIGGYYKKDTENPLELYIQVYSPEKQVVIDAVSTGLNVTSELGIVFEKKELEELNRQRTNDSINKLITGIRMNRDLSEQPQNIDTELLNKKIHQKINFPINKQGREKEIITKDTFDLIGSQEVVTASRAKESILDAPATIMVITEEEIKQRGYTSITEIFENIPGMDISFSNGVPYVTPYMRGYRSNVGQEILFMIDGKLQNDIWSQSIRVARQYPITNIKKIEILYGPSSVVYGPNATQGIINVITKSGSDLKEDGISTTISLQHGSFDTNALDSTVVGKNGDFAYTISGKYFKSNEPDLNDRKSDSYLNDFYYGFKPIWGPVLDANFNGKRFGKYFDPSLERSVLGNVSYRGLKMGIIYDQIASGSGTAYAGDQVQNNSNFGDESTMLYAEYDKTIGTKFHSFSQVLQRKYVKKGTWTEAFPDPITEEVLDEEGNVLQGIDPYHSLVSNTYWQSVNSLVQFNQIFDYQFTKDFKMSSGLNFTHRELSRNYDVPGYYGAFNSILVDDFDKYPNGYNVVSSSSTDPLPVTPIPNEVKHPMNTASIQDTGGYLLGVYDLQKFRFNAGVRYDKNSNYGSTVNPRITGIYKYSTTQAWKLTYGEAFQEPSADQLYGDSGGANYDTTVAGSVARIDLKPEKMRSGEAIWILQGKGFYNEISVFYNKYDRVIEQDFFSIYGKRIYGSEWKIRKFFQNPLPSSGNLSLFLFYSFVEARNSVTYSFTDASFSNGDTVFGKYEQYYTDTIYPETQIPLPRRRKYFSSGDIAKNKVNLGINVPIFQSWNMNLRGSYVGKRGLYTTNPLREEGITLDPYWVWHGTLTYRILDFGSLAFKVYNLFNEYYLHPGIEFAGGGNRYWERSQDYRNSILPQPGRYFLVNLTMTF
ncbi:MAG: TonB-dependent receptor [Leptospiraceae bacterium]|nr:TonB-dependent receptor [Leptospiraceae bacterium]